MAIRYENSRAKTWQLKARQLESAVAGGVVKARAASERANEGRAIAAVSRPARGSYLTAISDER